MTRIPSPETDPEHFPASPLEYEGTGEVEVALNRGDIEFVNEWLRKQYEKSHPHE